MAVLCVSSPGGRRRLPRPTVCVCTHSLALEGAAEWRTAWGGCLLGLDQLAPNGVSWAVSYVCPRLGLLRNPQAGAGEDLRGGLAAWESQALCGPLSTFLSSP